MKDPSQGSLASWWLVHNWFINLDNLLEVIVHHFLIRGMVGLSHWDVVSIVSVLVCMVTHALDVIYSESWCKTTR